MDADPKLVRFQLISVTAIHDRLFVCLFFSRYQAGAPMTEGVEVALDPSELELDPAAMQAR